MPAPSTPGLIARAAGAVHTRAFSLPPARTAYTITRGLRVPARDGAELVTDHYEPRAGARGAVLIRSPYGRGLPVSLLHGRMLAARGFHVLVQSVRGTGGSSGVLRPMTQEAADGQDTVAWLREQPWFDGRLATLGGSYLGWSQWSLLRDPPPELKAAVVVVGPHDMARAMYGTGAFALADFLGWSATVLAQSDGGLRQAMTSGRRARKATHETPLGAAAETALDGAAPWFAGWLSHADPADPFWNAYDASESLTEVEAPVLLVGGWHDVFLDQTLEQYRALSTRDVDVALTIGPWKHLDTLAAAARVIDRETLAWLEQHLDGGPARSQPVRVHVTGAGEWRTLPSWPPATTDRVLRLRADGRLGDTAGVEGASTGFRYDPADPTPAVGGRHMSAGAGARDNRALEARPDVLTFTSEPLGSALEVIGAPRVELALKTDNPHADVFVRLCDVDPRGRSRNVTEVFRRLDPGRAGALSLDLGACAHRFAAGHRLRLQVSGGAHPRYARNPGTGEPIATATTFTATRYTVHCARSTLTVPIA
ncbi:CocE/NonD family hydrolase [Amycolatopsis sp. NBC_00348]|uniref:CocE/NonD family hydrolase n=1 Tax=Amycolatopsis sp. NBC_00348 TaxID=2975956 RepID=UPI002E26D678